MPEKAVVHNKEVTKHLNALEQAFWENVERQDDCEYGSIGLDCKRPFRKFLRPRRHSRNHREETKERRRWFH